MALNNNNYYYLGLLQQILRRCTTLRLWHSIERQLGCDHPRDVPRDHFVVYVGRNRRRFVVPILCLRHPEFLKLLRQAEEEFGFDHDMGLTIPCDELAFQSLASSF